MSNVWTANALPVNPFVRKALMISLELNGCTPSELAARLADSEPMLSPFNRECAAREVLRLAADYPAQFAVAAEREALRRIARAWRERNHAAI
jgi:hypothetical protein